MEIESSIAQETFEILKKLSPQNQAYFMTMARIAEAAENGVKKNLLSPSHGSSDGTANPPTHQ